MKNCRSCWQVLPGLLLAVAATPAVADTVDAALAPAQQANASGATEPEPALAQVFIEAPIGTVTVGPEASVASRRKFATATAIGGSGSLITFSDRPPPPPRAVAPAASATISSGPLGSVMLPLARSRLTSQFGSRRHPITGGHRLHAGVDLAAPAGTPVQAFADGVVVQAGWSGGYGLLVSLAHSDGSQTRYAHLSRIAVAVGQRVNVGHTVGLVGSTGLSTGPHLHFERRVRGMAVNPL